MKWALSLIAWERLDIVAHGDVKRISVVYKGKEIELSNKRCKYWVIILFNLYAQKKKCEVQIEVQKKRECP